MTCDIHIFAVQAGTPMTAKRFEGLELNSSPFSFPYPNINDKLFP
jgi:hypothetical protein